MARLAERASDAARPAGVLSLYTVLPDDAEEYVVRRVGIIGLAVSIGVVQVHLALAVVSRSAQELVERGYTHLAQARAEAESAAHERLLTAAIAAFKKAYQAEPTAPPMQVHALLGAAQAYLLVQAPRRVFPFLWQATPLQRAEKSLRQALVLQPDNAAVSLLLGVVYWRQATQAAGQQQDAHERSKYYLTQAIVLGLPIALALLPERHAHPCTWFSSGDTIVALRYVDARGVGRMEDLIFVYRSAASEPLCGVVVTGRQAHPLTMDTTSAAHRNCPASLAGWSTRYFAGVPGIETGGEFTPCSTSALAPHGLLESITTISQPGQEPILVLRLRQGTQAQDLRFTWDGSRFVPLPALPSR